MKKIDISKENITKALSFYNITDKTYIAKCIECIDSMKSNNNLINKLNSLYTILYLENFDREKLKKLWYNQNTHELFAKDCHPFITNILLLSGYNIHKQNFEKYNLADEQKQIHIKRVYDALTTDIFKRHYAGIRVSQMLWGAYFINIRLIEVGRLQYELCYHNPVTEIDGETNIKIHIPRGGRLFIEDVKDSLKASKEYLKKYFGIESTNYYCSSWLLSKDLQEIIDKNSNIYKFYELFDIVAETHDAIPDILNFVFELDSCEDYSTLPENTSLQKNLKELLLAGSSMKVGIGKLKEGII